MTPARTIRFIEPQGRAGRPFNAWITRWPLLGPVTLATILSERGYPTSVYNENISGSLLDNPEAYEEICSADVVGISVMTPTASRGYALADRIRRDAPNVTIVFGGVHATFMPEEARAHGDVVVCGEGENVIEAIARGDVRSGILHPPPLEDLDRLPTLDHSLMCDFERLFGRSHRRELYELPVMTSRGCPHGCTYCSVSRMFGRRVRRQSVDKVHQDICRYMERGFRRLFFYDDNLTTHPRWTKALLERMEPMGLRFNAQVRADFPWVGGSRRRRDEELLHRMRRGGADVLYIGYETIEEQTAAAWKKGYRGEASLKRRLQEDTHVLHDNGFWIHGMFVLGPQHTAATADEIVKFARANDIESLQISILTPFPGTPLFEEMRPHLVFTDFPADWDYYDGTHCVYGNSRLGISRLQTTVLNAHRRFYRLAGLSLRRLQSMLRNRVHLGDTLALLWRQAGLVRSTFREWREETKTFLELVRAKCPEYF